MHAVGLRLCGMVEDPPRAVAAGLGGFAHFVLHEQRDIERHLAEARGVDAERRHQGRQPVAMRVPRRVRALQVQFLGQRFTHREAAVAQCGQGSAGAAELQVRRLRRSGWPRATSRAGRRPAIPPL